MEAQIKDGGGFGQSGVEMRRLGGERWLSRVSQ